MVTQLALDALTAKVQYSPGLVSMQTNFRTGFMLKLLSARRAPLTFEPLSACCGHRSTVMNTCSGCFLPLPGAFRGSLLVQDINRRLTIDGGGIREVLTHSSLDPLAQEIAAQKILQWFEPFIEADPLTWPRRGEFLHAFMKL